MIKKEILEWLKNEFEPLTLATPDDTLNQIIDNTIRHWNTNSGYKISTVVAAGGKIQLPASFKTVVQVFPNVNYIPVLVDFSNTLLLGMTVLDNVATDMIMMSEAFKNYKSYISGQFRWHWEKSEDPLIGGYLYTYNIPSGVTRLFCVGTKRIIGTVEGTVSGISGTLLTFPIKEDTLSLTNGTHVYNDDGEGILVSSAEGYSGTINYQTGVWSVTGWVSGETTDAVVEVEYEEDIKSEYLLNWILPYSKALLKITEGNLLRKSSIINIKNDGDSLISEGKEEKKELEESLGRNGRWVALAQRF